MYVCVFIDVVSMFNTLLLLQKSCASLENSLRDMSDQSVHLSSDNKLLHATVTELRARLELVSPLLSELNRLRRSLVSAKSKYSKVGNSAKMLSVAQFLKNPMTNLRS